MLRLEMAEGSPVSDKSANTDDKAAELMDFFEVSEAKDIKQTPASSKPSYPRAPKPSAAKFMQMDIKAYVAYKLSMFHDNGVI